MPINSIDGLIQASLDRILGGNNILTKSALRTLSATGSIKNMTKQTIFEKRSGKLLAMCGVTKCGSKEYVTGN